MLSSEACGGESSPCDDTNRGRGFKGATSRVENEE